MSLDLTQKHILITGSSDGLGKVLALELAAKGAIVTIHGRDKTKTTSVLNELKSISDKPHSALVCDFNKPNSIEHAFSSVKKLDVLINNAGVWQEGSTTKTSPEKIIELVNVNLTSYLMVTRLMLPILSKSTFGQVVQVISVAGYEVPSDYYHTIYSATKYGLQGFSEALAKEYEGKNVRIMGFYPGGMATKLFKKAGINYKAKEDWMFDPMESVETIIYMITRNPKINIKRLDQINHLFE